MIHRTSTGHSSKRSIQSAPAESFLGSFFRKARASKRQTVPTGYRQAVSAYNLDWQELKKYLEEEFGDGGFSKNMTLMEDKFVFWLPRPLENEHRQDIDDLRSIHVEERSRAASSDGLDKRTGTQTRENGRGSVQTL